MSFSKRQVLSASAVLAIAAAIAYVLWGGLEQNLVYFVTPSELEAKGEKAVGNPVRLGGVVAEGTVAQEANLLRFAIKDDKTQVRVVSTKTPPQMFQEGLGVVVEGALQPDRVFRADRLMVKHGNEYRPPEEGQMPQEIYKSLQKEPGF